MTRGASTGVKNNDSNGIFIMKISTISLNGMMSVNSLLQNYGAKVEIDSRTEQMSWEEPFHEKLSGEKFSLSCPFKL